MTIYKNDFGHEFHFNDVVECTMTFLPVAETVGRLVQVRKGRGQFGSDVYLIRRADKSLKSFENVSLRKSAAIVPIFDGDGIEVEYTRGGTFPETGFVIDNPKEL